MSGACIVGADIGGTFSDVVLTRADGGLHVAKLPTTVDEPERGVLDGIDRVLREAAVAASDVKRVVHGTTLAGNAVIERRGARVAFVTTEGFGDLLRIGREARVEDDRYDLLFEPALPPLRRRAIFELRERVDARGGVLVRFDEAHARDVAARIAAARPEAIALCFLHAHANPEHEERMRKLLEEALPGVPVVASSRVHPEMREFDRASTTLFTAEVAPLLASYLTRLRDGLVALGIDAPLQIMESSGGVMAAEVAALRAVATLESGAAAGVMAAARFATHQALPRVISFDMGGTTAKAGVVEDGRPRVVRELHVGGRGSFGGRRAGTGMPIRTPTIDLAEVGAGGGSIAWLDPEGMLRVGPRSAGADPGPACYARGGFAPTVTDADLVLGYLSPETFAGGSFRLDPERARDAIERDIARVLGTSVERAAWAIHEAANASMAAAIHVVTVQRGLDPRDHVLVAFGGAGPMHAAGVAERFGIERVLAPPEAGVASAIGMQATDLTAEHGRSWIAPAADLDSALVAQLFREVETAARAKMGVGERDESVEVERLLDLRFVGQSHELSVPAPEPHRSGEVADRFRARYRVLYGVAPEGPIEVAALRVRLRVAVDRPPLEAPAPPAKQGEPASARPAWFGPGAPVETRVVARNALPERGAVEGPAVVEGPVDTLVVPPGWTAEADATGSIHLSRSGQSRLGFPSRRRRNAR